MKNFIMLMALSMNAFGAVTVSFEGQEAKSAYDQLTGPQIVEEGDGSRNHRVGKDLDCSYLRAEMEDSAGIPVSSEDPLRYECRYVEKSLRYDANGAIKKDVKLVIEDTLIGFDKLNLYGNTAEELWNNMKKVTVKKGPLKQYTKIGKNITCTRGDKDKTETVCSMGLDVWSGKVNSNVLPTK